MTTNFEAMNEARDNMSLEEQQGVHMTFYSRLVNRFTEETNDPELAERLAQAAQSEAHAFANSFVGKGGKK